MDMEAKFHLSGGLDVVIANDSLPGSNALGSVRLVKWEGVCYDHYLGDEACKERKGEVLLMTKHQARAIASALMGCAAEA
jgi:hypothetical protein